MKTRISMTISKDLLKKLDSVVDGVQARSRSEAIENILNLYLDSNKVAVFLAGGNKDNLKIDGVYKPLIKIDGHYLIDFAIDNLKKAGFRKIFCIGSDEILKKIFKVLGNGENNNLNITYIEENKVQGNAKTLQLAEQYITSPFLVIPIDNYFDFDLNSLFRKHMLHDSLATVAVQATRENLSDLGVVEMLGDKITGYEECPKNPKTFIASTSIAIYNPKIFSYIPKGDIKWVLQKDVFPKIVAEHKMYGCMVGGPRLNIHTKDDITRLKKIISHKK
ncbi:MAG: hypothetical protein K0B02_00840 [DPANN group archaeon]|nr:hypothetical protein [DPANN group archaeon]